MNQPSISIITVVFNGMKTLEKTILSVVAQTYKNIEYILVDGGSTDGTADIVARYMHQINIIISEEDEGIYDAMNKGINAASGEYLFFLNADDCFAANDVLEKMIATKPNADVYYGDVMIVDEMDNKLGLRSKITPHKVPEKLHWKSLKRGMVVSHQAFLVKKSITPLYDLHYKIAADIDWMIRVLKNAKSVINTHLVIAKFKTGGTSKQKQHLAWKERYRIFSKHFGTVNNFFNHAYIVARYIITKPFKKGI